jgi:hypothetical protein
MTDWQSQAARMVEVITASGELRTPLGSRHSAPYPAIISSPGITRPTTGVGGSTPVTNPDGWRRSTTTGPLTGRGLAHQRAG